MEYNEISKIYFFEFKHYVKNPDVVQIKFTNCINEIISGSKTSTLFKTSTFFGVINDKKKRKKTYKFLRVDVYQKGPFLK